MVAHTSNAGTSGGGGEEASLVLQNETLPQKEIELKKREKEKKLFSKVCCHSLSSQHLEGGGRKIRSSKPSWAIGD